MLGSLVTFRRRLLGWFDRHRRDLPWRLAADAPAGASLDPYHVLVSEAMLQQTQVATVIPYYHRFLNQFPTLRALADAPEQDVLRVWQGLGYYSRARNLQAAARVVVADFDGQLPANADALLALPGVGRYTAGAVASIAFGQRAPILDGNVLRVLCRLDAIESDPRDRATQELLWLRAEQILPTKRVGDFNSALMELGALVCTPRNPQCLLCPVREHCAAFAAGLQDRIPLPKVRKPTPLFRRDVLCLRLADRWLLEQRRARGRWAGMWQFPTFDQRETSTAPTAQVWKSRLGFPLNSATPIGTVAHALTHRRYEFSVFTAALSALPARSVEPRRWLTLSELAKYPLPRPHLKIVEMLEKM